MKKLIASFTLVLGLAAAGNVMAAETTKSEGASFSLWQVLVEYVNSDCTDVVLH